MDTILVAVSATSEGQAALEHAATHARAHGASLLLAAYVSDPRTETQARSYQARREEEQERLERWAGLLVPDEVPWKAEVTVAGGDAATALLELARSRDVDLIVIGIRRRSPAGKVLLGSTAQDVLLRADCPVLAVKAPDDRE